MKTEVGKVENSPTTPKTTSILIETVKNGYVVYENYFRDPMRDPGMARDNNRMVFNTKDQLNKYINDNLE